MIMDGKSLAEKIKQELEQQVLSLGFNPVLGIVMVGEDPASKKYIEKKIKFGQAIGVETRLFAYDSQIAETELIADITRLVNDQAVNGLIVQLPLPKQFQATQVLKAVNPAKDVDALSDSARVLSPVVRAVKELLEAYRVDLKDKEILVVGAGKLVGRPVASWLAQIGMQFKLVDSAEVNLADKVKTADILILGTGQSHLIKPEMIKAGAVIIDAGTSEAGNKLSGDADPACAERASLMTPVPGGIGPLTVAMLFKNLVELTITAHLEAGPPSGLASGFNSG